MSMRLARVHYNNPCGFCSRFHAGYSISLSFVVGSREERDWRRRLFLFIHIISLCTGDRKSVLSTRAHLCKQTLSCAPASLFRYIAPPPPGLFFYCCFVYFHSQQSLTALFFPVFAFNLGFAFVHCLWDNVVWPAACSTGCPDWRACGQEGFRGSPYSFCEYVHGEGKEKTKQWMLDHVYPCSYSLSDCFPLINYLESFSPPTPWPLLYILLCVMLGKLYLGTHKRYRSQKAWACYEDPEIIRIFRVWKEAL